VDVEVSFPAKYSIAKVEGEIKSEKIEFLRKRYRRSKYGQ
jgi:hypothetical protein